MHCLFLVRTKIMTWSAMILTTGLGLALSRCSSCTLRAATLSESSEFSASLIRPLNLVLLSLTLWRRTWLKQLSVLMRKAMQSLTSDLAKYPRLSEEHRCLFYLWNMKIVVFTLTVVTENTNFTHVSEFSISSAKLRWCFHERMNATRGLL